MLGDSVKNTGNEPLLAGWFNFFLLPFWLVSSKKILLPNSSLVQGTVYLARKTMYLSFVFMRLFTREMAILTAF